MSKLLNYLIIIFLFGYANSVASLPEVATILKVADSFRLPTATARVETLVELYKNEVLEKSREYRVYLKPGRRSLVLFRSPQEAGQKVLMVEENFWMLMPNSRRPIRITPIQKLLGEAATGDIATLTWSEYYSGTLVEADTDYQGTPALSLALDSKVKGTTYAHIDLWVARDDYAPLAADLYVQSGKLAKQAKFITETVAGQRRVVRMTLLDRLQRQRRTEVKMLSVTAAELPDKYFNPMFLIRNNLEETE
ncbi:MAG: outer membrane lipoprotein-sorting protein [Thioploca sp.]|nr:outer membrane lipoprotein-sorting protein [Thioploca sp.]